MEKRKTWHDLLPALLAILVTLVTPYLLPMGLRSIAPPLGLSVIFYFRSRVPFMNVAVWIALLSGLLLDVIQAMPVGVGISAALLLYWLARPREERDEDRSFARNLLRFTWVSPIIMGWIYLLMSMVQGQFFPMTLPIFQWLAMVASYPLIYAFCHAIHQMMLQSKRYSL